jgi:two-component system sensor histidine kinase KdpD
MSRSRLARTRPWLGGAVGGIGVLVVNGAFIAFDADVTRAIPLLLLFVPVTAAGVIGGWRASVPVAVGSGLLYSLAFLAPVGSIRVGLTEDMATLVTFVAVAITVSAISGVRVQALSDRELQRAVLLRSVSHDLRNPLSTIRAASADLRDELVSDPAARIELLEMVVDETDRLDRIVGNLLDLSRIEAGALTPALEPESIADIVDDTVVRLRRGPGGMRIDVRVPRDLPDVLVDRVQIEQVVTNLLENARRHGGAATTACVTAASAGATVRVTVSDDGAGFSADARSGAFSFFGSTQTPDSIGLGLALCKAIVEAHGGTIALGEQPGRGASITFSVPTA